MSADVNEPLARTEQEWRDRFAARMDQALGDPVFSRHAAEAAEVDLAEVPECCAESELSYMAEG